MNVLFVCNFGQNRSATARDMWTDSHPEDNAKAVGVLLNNEDEVRIAAKWADIIFVMEKHQEEKMKEVSRGKKVINLNIENSYPYDSEELKALISSRLKTKGY